MNKFLKLLSLNIECDDNLSYRRIILVTSILITTVIVFILFALLNSYLSNNYIVAGLDITAAIISAYAIYHLKKYQLLPRAAKIATFNLIFFFLSFIYISEASHYSLIWSIFIPIFAILTNGKKIGLYFSLGFYLILYSISFNAIGMWNNGEWLILDWFRLVFSSIVLTFIMYMNESALEESDRKLTQTRKSEKLHLEELRNLSITDQLTGLYNRRYYNDMIPKLMSLAKKRDHYITFFILDVDYFKNYNDNYGHIKGDETLIKISHAIQGHVQRGDDFVFRLGGEEFAGIIISDNKEKTHKWISSLCESIENLKIEHSKSEVSSYVTVSIGISTICHELNYNMDHLYSFADEALYIAKNDGRNRSELSIQCA